MNTVGFLGMPGALLIVTIVIAILAGVTRVLTRMLSQEDFLDSHEPIYDCNRAQPLLMLRCTSEWAKTKRLINVLNRSRTIRLCYVLLVCPDKSDVVQAARQETYVGFRGNRCVTFRHVDCSWNPGLLRRKVRMPTMKLRTRIESDVEWGKNWGDYNVLNRIWHVLFPATHTNSVYKPLGNYCFAASTGFCSGRSVWHHQRKRENEESKNSLILVHK